MRSAILSLVVSLSVTSGTNGGTADFSGVWQLDLARSDAAAHVDTPGPITVTINQSAESITIATTTSKGTTEITYTIVARDAPPLAGGPNARWDGETLVTNAVRDISGQSVTVQQSRRLSRDGKEMTVESIVNVQHGYTVRSAQTYGASTDVFVRVR